MPSKSFLSLPFMAVLLILLGAGCAAQKNNARPTTSKIESPAPEPRVQASSTAETVLIATDKQIQKPTTVNPPLPGTPEKAGAVLAGTFSPLLEFNQADYNAATKSGKLVILYFFANWCSICKTEFPEMVDAFNQLSTNQVAGFRVHFNDSEATDEQTALAREFGVAYQHTKVFVKNGQRVIKAPDSWDQEKYLLEIMEALK